MILQIRKNLVHSKVLYVNHFWMFNVSKCRNNRSNFSGELWSGHYFHRKLFQTSFRSKFTDKNYITFYFRSNRNIKITDVVQKNKNEKLTFKFRSKLISFYTFLVFDLSDFWSNVQLDSVFSRKLIKIWWLKGFGFFWQ